MDEPQSLIPGVVLQGGVQCAAKAHSEGQHTADGEDACDANGIQILEAGTAVNGTVTDEQEVVYRVPSGAEIILTSVTGDAELYLLTSPEYSSDALVCNGSSPYREHNCTATSDSGELFALVYGREAADYSLAVTTDCSVESVNNWVYRNMKDYYLYAESVPAVNPASYDSAGALVRDLRLEELDPYSNVQDAVRQEEFQESGRSFGFGFRWKADDAGNARIVRVYNDSPFGRLGISRSDIIVSINGVAWNDMSGGLYAELTGSRDNPLTATWEFIKGDTGATEFLPITIGEYTANTVSYASTFVSDRFDGTVGYLVFDGFIRTSEAELNSAIGRLQSLEITELVLDLRYNPGGLISIANQLASQIAGPAIENELLVRYQYNNKYTDQNFDFDAVSASPSLNLDRVIVLTTEKTASASELVINSLRPYMEVVTIGEKTLGKAFISAPKTFCGKSLNAMEAEGVNANNVSVAGGIPADCYAADDVTRRFGNESGTMEGMLASSLDYLLTGACAAPTFTKRPDVSGPLAGDPEVAPSAVKE